VLLKEGEESLPSYLSASAHSWAEQREQASHHNIQKRSMHIMLTNYYVRFDYHFLCVWVFAVFLSRLDGLLLAFVGFCGFCGLLWAFVGTHKNPQKPTKAQEHPNGSTQLASRFLNNEKQRTFTYLYVLA
jgi:hypothetical protein